MKKAFIIVFSALIAFTVFATTVLATPSNILYLLNWGEYIDMSLLAEFESTYHCQVVLETVTSSEAMYQKIAASTTSYDVAIPGDYTVAELHEEGLIRRLDVNNPDLPYLGAYKTSFSDDLSSLIYEYMKDEHGVYNDYFMPYFWGAYCAIYSSRPGEEEVEAALKEKGFEAFYNRNLYSSPKKIGMYDTARWILASYLLSQGLDPNITDRDGSKDDDLSPAMVEEAKSKLKEAHFDEFGNDQLKRNVATGSLDMCFTQLGDFFDTLFLSLEEGKSIEFNVVVPKVTAAFFDSMVIPSTCQNYSLANKFINFMLNPEKAYQNAKAIGYSPTLKSVVELYKEDARKGAYYFGETDSKDSLLLSDFLSRYPVYLDPLAGKKDAVYMLEPKSIRYLTTCETIFNSLA